MRKSAGSESVLVVDIDINIDIKNIDMYKEINIGAATTSPAGNAALAPEPGPAPVYGHGPRGGGAASGARHGLLLLSLTTDTSECVLILLQESKGGVSVGQLLSSPPSPAQPSPAQPPAASQQLDPGLGCCPLCRLYCILYTDPGLWSVATNRGCAQN